MELLDRKKDLENQGEMARLTTLMTEILVHDKSHHSAFRSDLQDEIISRYNLLDVFREVLAQDQSERVKHLAVCTVLCAKCSNDWFIESIQAIIQNKSYSVVKEILHLGFVPTQAEKEHYIFDKNDFVGIANMAVTVLSVFNIMLEKFSEEFDQSDVMKMFLSKIIPELLYLVLEHTGTNLWTSELSIVVAKNLLRLLKLFYKSESNETLLTSDADFRNSDIFKTAENSILNQLLKLLNPRLIKTNWTKYPSAKSVFQWCLFHTKYPHLYEHLEKVLPPSLNFVYDYIPENRITGIHCLRHIMENVSSEELRWYGHADVIYQALKQQLYTNEAELNKVSYPAVLKVLGIVESFSGLVDLQGTRKTVKHDEILQIVLQNAECENKIVLRQIVTSFLVDFVDEMGLMTVKHLQTILQIVGSYLEVYEGSNEISRINALTLLEKVLKNCWPRFSCYVETTIKMLLKFLCSLSIQDSARSDNVTLTLTEKVITCLKLVKLIGGVKCEMLLKAVDSTELPPLCLKVLKDVQHSIDCTG